MPRLLQTPQSRADIAGIVRYVRNENPRAAIRVLKAIKETLDRLSEFPNMGQARDDLVPGLRSLPVSRFRNYIVYYLPLRDGIDVLRVLHGARDTRKAFGL